MNSDKIVSIMNLNLFSADKTFWAKQRWGKWLLKWIFNLVIKRKHGFKSHWRGLATFSVCDKYFGIPAVMNISPLALLFQAG